MIIVIISSWQIQNYIIARRYNRYIIHEFASTKADLYLPLKYSPENVCVTQVCVPTYILNTEVLSNSIEYSPAFPRRLLGCSLLLLSQVQMARWGKMRPAYQWPPQHGLCL